MPKLPIHKGADKKSKTIASKRLWNESIGTK
jgi:hypothetical protein